MSSQMEHPQASENEIQELMSEIAFQKVLLSTIDDTVSDREEAEKNVKEEIRRMERQLKLLRRDPNSTTSNRGNICSQATDDQSSPNPRAGNSVKSEGVDTNMSRFMNQSHEAYSSTASTPNSLSSLADFLSPSKMTLPTRKRTHTSHLDGATEPIEVNKSRRTSPRPGTASTSSGDEFDAEFDEEFFKGQIAAVERLEREKLDAELARNLQSSASNPEHLPAPAPSATPLSAFDRISGIRPSANNNTSGGPGASSQGRRLPWNVSNQNSNVPVKSETGSMVSGSSFGVPPTSSANSTQSTALSHAPRVKKEVQNMPGSFHIDLDDSDSDLEIISASSFIDNKRHTSSKAMLEGQPTPFRTNGISHQNKGSASKGLYSHPAYNDSDLHPGLPAYGMNVGYNDLEASSQYGMSHIPGSYPGGNVHHPEQGLGYTMNKLPDHGINSQPPPDYLSPLQLVQDLLRQPNKMENENYLTGKWNEQNWAEARYIADDPRKTVQEIKDLLENIRPDVELPPEDREGTPDGLKYPLYEHQKLALTWLKSMEEGSNKGGILADDMGLGKTISTLALILTRPSDDRTRKTTLIVGPVALVRQWKREIQTKIKAEYSLSIHLVHGAARKLKWDELRTYDVVLTTYGTVGAELRRLEKFREQHKGGPIDEAKMAKDFPLLGPKSQFYRIILDEAQCIKNKNTGAARACCHLKSVYRLCLTGTPMMNNVGELYSLIRFLQIRPYNEWAGFQEQFGMLTKGDGNGRRDVQACMRKLQALLKAILLRRNKSSLIDGKPIINLPPKVEEIQHVVFNEDEQEFYKSLENKTQLQFNKYKKAGTIGKNYTNVLVLLLRLRQACCHPHLIHDFEDAATAGGNVPEEIMLELAKNLAPEVIARILAADDNFECPVCYDAVPNPSILIPCGHDTCSECLTKITDQAVLQNVANGDEGANQKCPTCRGKISMDKIIDYSAFKKVHRPDPLLEEDVENASQGSDDDSETDSESEMEDEDNSDGDLRDFIVPDDIEDDDVETNDDNDDDLMEDDDYSPAQKKARPSKDISEKDNEKKRRKIKKGKRKAKDPKKDHFSISDMKKEAAKTLEGRRRYMKYLRKNWVESAKLQKCVELVEKFQSEGEKTIVFSQFVSLLDLLQVPVEKKGWNFERYDGSMSADARNNAINRFIDKPNTKLMLISLKAGNAGINLVAASRVIILDPFWNPYIEMQAVDRAYRIGQQKPVEVHRILVEGTVEDRIIELQERKRKLVDAALDEGANKSLGRLDYNQLAFLFGVS